MSAGARPAATARGRARRDQLTSVAAELFARDGFHNVSVNDIAAAAGVSGPAIYRHFPSKQAILGHLLQTALEEATGIIEYRLGRPPASRDPGQRLRDVYGELAAFVLRRPELGPLWRRERRQLDHSENVAAARMAQRVATPLVSELLSFRTELTRPEAELLSWSALSVFGSISDHRVRLPQAAAVERLLTSIAMDVVTAELPAPGLPSRSVQVPILLDTRREQLTAAAARLFRDRGYHAVTMEDIGAEAGIAGPSIYSHFAAKQELLQAAADRIAEKLRQTTAAEPGEEVPVERALAVLVDHYVETVLQYRDFVAAYFTEGHNLPERKAAEARRFQRAYAQHWANLVMALAPQAPAKEARIRVHAAFAVANDIAQTRRFTSRPDLVTRLPALLRVLLNVNDP